MLKEKVLESYCRKLKGVGKLPPIHFSFIVNSFFPFNLVVNKHPNLKEFKAILEILKSRHSFVFITDYRYQKKIPDCEYFFGFGAVANNLNYVKSKSTYYSTGASSFYQIKAVNKELNWLEENYWLPSLKNFRLPEELNTIGELNSHLHFCIGNNWTKSTFKDDSNIVCLPGIPNGQSDNNINFGLERGHNLLWLGSKGIFHKGLHLAAQVAFNLKRKLYAVGINKDELSEAIKILKNSKCNYEIHEFIDIPSNTWFEVVNDCRICLGCSISEGMSTSLLTALQYGVYPVSLVSCGINYGYVKIPESLNDRVSLLTSSTDKLLRLSSAVFYDLVMNDMDIMLKNNNLYAFQKVIDENYNV